MSSVQSVYVMLMDLVDINKGSGGCFCFTSFCHWYIIKSKTWSAHAYVILMDQT